MLRKRDFLELDRKRPAVHDLPSPENRWRLVDQLRRARDFEIAKEDDSFAHCHLLEFLTVALLMVTDHDTTYPIEVRQGMLGQIKLYLAHWRGNFALRAAREALLAMPFSTNG